MLGMPASGKRFDWLRGTLAEAYNLASTNLKNGRVPDEADLLLLASPDRLNIKQLFAVDQFLMRGGTVIIATSLFDVEFGEGLTARKNESALLDWLEYHGIALEAQMACGDGACLGCVVESIQEREGEKMVRVCCDGPVLDTTLIDWHAHNTAYDR